MSTQNALNFIRYLRSSEKGLADLHENRLDADLNSIVLLGRQHGFEFSVEDIRKAFRADWGMRARYHSSSTD